MTAMSPTEWLLDVPLVVAGRNGQCSPLTANQPMHWRVKARHVATIREAVAWQAKVAHIGPQEHVRVQLHYAPGDVRRRDASNVMPTQKAAVDGLVDAGVVPDDTARWVTELMPVLHLPDGDRYQARSLWLVVEAVDVPAEVSR